MLRILNALNEHLHNALTSAYPQATADIAGITLEPLLVPASKPEFGDFQMNGAMQLAKPLKQSPRKIALAIIDQLQTNTEFLI